MPMTDMVRQLLEKRAIPEDSWETFLSPDYISGTHDPFLMKDMDKAVARVLKAIESKEKIVVYSDYDCDGIPGAVILHDFFKAINYEHFTVYIPDRHDEGYGLHRDAVETFIAQGTNLIITIDLGITAIPEIAYAQESGVDVIVTDHHIPHETLPPAFAILNPKQPGCDYPFKELCGSGVMFKLIQALMTKVSMPVGFDKWLLDMVGLATLSDMVPLVGENRVFAY
jgi:single-stranded-DNA-specific exonuclease